MPRRISLYLLSLALVFPPLSANGHAAESKRVDGISVRTQAALEQTFILQPISTGSPSSPDAPTGLTDPDPIIQQMIAQVDQSTVEQYVGDLSGEWPIEIRGESYSIPTRYTYSGLPIYQATRYVEDHLKMRGLNVERHIWGTVTAPNVIGELRGYTHPEEVYIIGAHLDSMPDGFIAPGADDNASGSAAVLNAADILSRYAWDCTLRFALWTGEEQWTILEPYGHGSRAYVQRALDQGEQFAAYLNLDMIGYNTPGSDPIINLEATSTIPETQGMAQLFSDVIQVYHLDLIPYIIPNAPGEGDHGTFWEFGIPAIMGIEWLNGDFNPNYHTTQDRLSNLDPVYMTDFVKAGLGTFVHLSGCLMPGRTGSIGGLVTSNGNGSPVPYAEVSFEDPVGRTYPLLVDASGHYTRSLIAGTTYTMSVRSPGYMPAVLPDISIITGTDLNQNVVLDPVAVIKVDPPAIWVRSESSQVHQKVVNVTNSGQAPLDFLIYPDPADAWLSASPIRGEVLPQAATSITVTLDTLGLPAGRHNGHLRIDSNALNNPQVTIYVTLEIDELESGKFLYLPLQRKE